MYRSLFARDVFSELDRLQREMNTLFDYSPQIRGIGRGGYPALNVGVTPEAVEVYAFVPGLDPAAIEVNLDRGVLTIDGERKSAIGNGSRDPKSTVHLDERFAGRFRRVVSLPEDADPAAVKAEYRDGVLRVTIGRREAAKPRRITVN
ncbi:MAG: Hsp20/alpha crystallin family protein [Rubrivivax sp.]|jgi:HSP20 family protein|nr:Hsp20/alpha crystallin family protein [Rubrivivax sp.]